MDIQLELKVTYNAKFTLPVLSTIIYVSSLPTAASVPLKLSWLEEGIYLGESGKDGKEVMCDNTLKDPYYAKFFLAMLFFKKKQPQNMFFNNMFL